MPHVPATLMKRVLIVDDNTDSREMLGVLLELEGYEVHLARDGEQALQLQRSAPVDVVLTDIFMPDKDGVETIRDLCSEFPQTKIIAMSGAANYKVDYLSLSLELGASKVLRKPFDSDALLEALREVLGPGDRVRHDSYAALPFGNSYRFDRCGSRQAAAAGRILALPYLLRVFLLNEC